MIPPAQREVIVDEIEGRLQAIVDHPDDRWGTITNTSIEGSSRSGNWLTDDKNGVFVPIATACGNDADAASMFFGMVWKWIIIRRARERGERWIGVRSSEDRPTFPQRGILLAGKSYFLAT